MASGVSTVRIQETISTKPNANGLAVIISNDHKGGSGNLKELPGTRSDAASMKSTLDKSLNFAVHHEHNVSLRTLRSLLTTVAGRGYPPSYRRVIIVFTGHGTKGLLYTNDEKTVKIDEMLTTFSPDRARNIGNIPKLFFIDACRGDEGTKSALVPRGEKGATLAETVSVPNESNFLVAFATLSNCKSYETRMGGTWMTMLAEQLKQNASICDILTFVNKELMKSYQACHKDTPLQQPEFISRLNEPVNLYVEAQLIRKITMGPTVESGRNTQLVRMARESEIPQHHKSQLQQVQSQKKESTPQKLRSSPHKSALEEYCRAHSKPLPSYETSRTTTGGGYRATAYVAKTIGRVAGEPQKRKYEAEEDAARAILQKLRGQKQ